MQMFLVWQIFIAKKKRVEKNAKIRRKRRKNELIAMYRMKETPICKRSTKKRCAHVQLSRIKAPLTETINTIRFGVAFCLSIWNLLVNSRRKKTGPPFKTTFLCRNSRVCTFAMSPIRQTCMAARNGVHVKS